MHRGMARMIPCIEPTTISGVIQNPNELHIDEKLEGEKKILRVEI